METKRGTYYNKVDTKSNGLNVEKYGVECESFTIISIASFEKILFTSIFQKLHW